MRRYGHFFLALILVFTTPAAWSEPKKPKKPPVQELVVGEIDREFTAVTLNMSFEHPELGHVNLTLFGMKSSEKLKLSRRFLNSLKQSQKAIKTVFHLYADPDDQAEIASHEEQLRLFEEHNIDAQLIHAPKQELQSLDEIEEMLSKNEVLREFFNKNGLSGAQLKDVSHVELPPQQLKNNHTQQIYSQKPTKLYKQFALVISTSVAVSTAIVSTLNPEISLERGMLLTLFNSGFAGAAAYFNPTIHAWVSTDKKAYARNAEVSPYREAARRAVVLGVPLHFGRLMIAGDTSKTTAPVNIEQLSSFADPFYFHPITHMPVGIQESLQNALSSLDPVGFLQLTSLLLFIEGGSIIYNTKLRRNIAPSDAMSRNQMTTAGLVVGSLLAIMSGSGYGDPTGISVLAAYLVMAQAFFNDGLTKWADRVMKMQVLFYEATKALGFSLRHPIKALKNSCATLLSFKAPKE